MTRSRIAPAFAALPCSGAPGPPTATLPPPADIIPACIATIATDERCGSG